MPEAQQVAHVLSRLTFGARPGDAELVKKMGVDRWIDWQLRPDSIADTVIARAMAVFPGWSADPATLKPSDLTRRVALTLPKMTDSAGRPLPQAEILKLQQLLVASVQFQPQDQFAGGKIARAQASERQLLEVITDFWENHFSVFNGKMPTTDAIATWDRAAIRPHALGKFRTLLGAVAHSPGMLFYLDNHLSTKSGLNENYARELMELHTLGVDGGYTQQDVIEVARALTGWTITPDRTAPLVRVTQSEPSRFTFVDARHDSGAKTVLGVKLAAGRGIEDGEQVLDILARHPSTAHYVSLKLARRLVGDDPPATLVDRATARFMKTDGDIAAVVREIVTSPEFFSADAFRSKVKTPFEFIVSARRALGSGADTTTASAILLRDFGHPTFGRATPDGWPDNQSAWMNSGAVLKRVMFANDVAEGRATNFKTGQWNGWAIAQIPIEKQADAVINALLGGYASPETRAAMQALTKEAFEGQADVSTARVKAMVAMALGSPEFQHR